MKRNRLLAFFLFLISFIACLPAAADQNPYDKWLNEEVRWIITRSERSEFAALKTDQERLKFVEDFWERRNPQPGNKENVFKEEHYRRIAYSQEHFSTPSTSGAMSDRGHAYILLGPPDQIESRLGALPEQVWHYHHLPGRTRELVITFADTCRCGEYNAAGNPFE